MSLHLISIDGSLALIDNDIFLKLFYQGCVAFINLWSTNVDPEIWPEPHKFLPERHLNDQGEFIKSDRLLTFGLG